MSLTEKSHLSFYSPGLNITSHFFHKYQQIIAHELLMTLLFNDVQHVITNIIDNKIIVIILLFLIKIVSFGY